MARLIQQNEKPAPRTRARSRKVTPTKPVETEPKKFQRSTRGRKAEAIKEFIPPTIKKYRTRKDYIGDRWKHLVDEATPESLRGNTGKIDFEPTPTAKETMQKRTNNTVKSLAATEENQPAEVTMKIVNNVKSDAKGNQPMAAEFAYNLMELCSKYMFVMKDAFNGEDGITEIDIHIKVKPTSSFTGKGCAA